MDPGEVSVRAVRTNVHVQRQCTCKCTDTDRPQCHARGSQSAKNAADRVAMATCAEADTCQPVYMLV